MKARRWQPSPPVSDADQWSENYEVRGVTIDVQHSTVEAMEHTLADVLERSDPSLPKQVRISALLSALPLFNAAALVEWQQQAAVYPHELAVARVRTYLTFRPSWEQEVLAERNDLLLVA
jgi:hypothetical protein